MTSITDNSKDFWAYVRQKTKPQPGVSDLKDPQGHVVQDNKQKADLLNDFFASVFVQEPPGPLPVFDQRYNGTTVSKLVVFTDEAFKRLNSLNVLKSMSVIPVYLKKQLIQSRNHYK